MHTKTPQRDLDCSLVSLPLSSRLDAHPGGMWFVSRYKTSPLRNYITSTSHKGLARGRRMLVLVQLSPGISSTDSMQLETDPAAPEPRVYTGTCALMQHFTDVWVQTLTDAQIPSLCCPPARVQSRNSLGAHDHCSLQTPTCSGTQLQQCPSAWAFSPGVYGYRYVYTPCQGVVEVGGRVE